MPIVEPDISLNGDYDLETAIRVNVKVQAHLYKAMLDHGVFMEGSTLKPNMVNPGRGCKSKSTAKEIGEATVTALRRVMPAAMPGVNFLSGGQTLEDAAARLCAINQVCFVLVGYCVGVGGDAISISLLSAFFVLAGSSVLFSMRWWSHDVSSKVSIVGLGTCSL